MRKKKTVCRGERIATLDADWQRRESRQGHPRFENMLPPVWHGPKSHRYARIRGLRASAC